MKKFLILAISISILFSCTIKKPEAPEWEVELVLPLVNEDYFVKDLADTTDDYILASDNDTMKFSYTDTLDTVRVGDKLSVEGSSESFNKLIGDELSINDREENFSLDVGDSLRISEQSEYFEYPLDKIEVDETGKSYSQVQVLEFVRSQIPGVGPVDDEPIPPIYHFPPIDTTFNIFDNENIQYVVIDSGFAYIDFTNNTELPLSSADSTHYMRFEIYSGEEPDPENDPIIIHEINSIIDPNSTEHIELNLSGKKVYENNYLRVKLTTDGTNGQPIDVSESDNFYVEFSVSEMTVSEASAKLPSETIRKDKAVSLQDANDEVSVQSAIIDSCQVNIDINNYLPLDATVRFEFVELLDDSGQPFQYDTLITHTPPQNNITLDLSGYEIQSSPKSTLDSLHFTYKVVTEATDNFVEINNTQYVSCDFQIGEMWFQELTGRVNHTFELDDEFDLSDASDKITLEEAIFRTGEAIIDISGLDFTPQLEITFDQIKDNQLNPLVLTNDDFSGYQFGENPDQVVIDENQIVSYEVIATIPDELITISSDDSVRANIQLSNFVFEEITGQFQSFTIEDTDATEIDSTGEYDIQYAEIDSCDANISITTNPLLPVDTDVSLTFNEIFTASGDTLTLTLSAPGDTIISFAGYSIGESETSAENIDSLHYCYKAITTPTSENVTLHYSDEINANIEIGEILLKKVKGTIYDKVFEVDPQEKSINLGDLPDSLNDVFTFTNAELKMDIYNGLDFNSTFNTIIHGFNTETGQTESVLIQDETLLPNQNNTFYKDISNFLSIIPDSIFVDTVKVTINGTGTVTASDSVTGNFELRTPLKFVINDKQNVKMDSLHHIEIEEDACEKIEKNLRTVQVPINLENKLPFGLVAYLQFATDSLNVWNAPGLVIDSLVMDPAEIDTSSHSSGEPTTSKIEITLTHEDGDLTMFTNPDVYLGIKFDIIGSDNESVYIKGTDKINVNGALKARVNIDEGLTEE